MIPLLMILGFFTPVRAIVNSEVIVGYKEICPDVYRIDVLINNAYLDTYYEYPEDTDWFSCAIYPQGLVDPLDDYPR